MIAASFSETYKRNAFNNGFVVFECPELVEHSAGHAHRRARRPRSAPEIVIDYGKSVLTIDGKSFAFPPLSPAAQELVVAGGAEVVVARRLARQPHNDLPLFAVGTAVSISTASNLNALTTK